MDELSERWMAYIDAEVRKACRLRGLGYQVRRKWTVREKPVSDSPVDDYEWKLLTGDRCDPDRPELGTDESDEGRYYLLELDRARGKFILYHDNHYGGDGSFLHLATFTEIRFRDPFHRDLMCARHETEDAVAAARVAPPRRRPAGSVTTSSISQAAYGQTGLPSPRTGCYQGKIPLSL